jgi:hypothetical protein
MSDHWRSDNDNVWRIGLFYSTEFYVLPLLKNNPNFKYISQEFNGL